MTGCALTRSCRGIHHRLGAMLLVRNSSHILAVDLQERVAPAIPQPWEVVDLAVRLVTAAARLSVPTTSNEHPLRASEQKEL